jgi:hypothetical protein
MRTNRIAQIIVICTVSSIAFSGARQSTSDGYDSKLIRAWVEYDPAFLAGNSWLEKSVYRSGDRIALGIAHAFSTAEILEPNRLNRILAIVRLSFSQPALIREKPDADPAVTTLLLSFIEHQQSDPDATQKVIETQRYISMQLKNEP